jgi:hypothetical protein
VEAPKNDRTNAVARLCLALESFRRTEEGRVRDSKAFLAHFFPGEDRLFRHMPHPVRADLLAGWGIRGKKSALRDDDARVRTTVQDALAAGDIDDVIVEEGVTPELLIDWVPLSDWWRFWRSEALPLPAVKKALDVARSLTLFDDRWFLDHLALPSGKLSRTDVVCAGLSKLEAMQWLAAVHAREDASPAGLVAALGWETLLEKTAHEALLHALDALARTVGLADSEATMSASEALPAPPSPVVASPVEPAAKPTPPEAAAAAAVPSPESAPQSSAPAISTNIVQTPKASKPEPADVPVRAAAPTPAASKAPVPASTPKPAAKGPAKPPPLPPRASRTDLSAINAARTASAPPAEPPASAAPGSPSLARALFGVPEPLISEAKLPPMRPKAATISGVGPEDLAPPMVDPPTIELATPAEPPSDPLWMPPRAEPGDMGYDIVHGIQRPMSTHVQPKYNFDDDEPTSEIALPRDRPR